MSEDRVTYDVGAAQATLDADRKRRVETCVAELEAILERYRCTIVAVTRLSGDGRIVAQVQVIAQ